MPRPPSLVFRHCHSVRRERDGRPKINSSTSEEGFISGENGERDKDGVKEAEIGSERREKSPTERARDPSALANANTNEGHCRYGPISLRRQEGRQAGVGRMMERNASYRVLIHLKEAERTERDVPKPSPL